jgi:hypothetical protein
VGAGRNSSIGSNARGVPRKTGVKLGGRHDVPCPPPIDALLVVHPPDLLKVHIDTAAVETAIQEAY